MVKKISKSFLLAVENIYIIVVCMHIYIYMYNILKCIIETQIVNSSFKSYIRQ
jgi:hypothetical protein